jgi:hypothetical protein
MTLLRRIAAPVATLLIALVCVQTLDLLACADESAALESSGGFHVDAAVTAGAHPSLSPGEGHDEHRPHEDDAPAMPDCLCHVVYTPTGHLPGVEAVIEAETAQYAAYVGRPSSANAKPLDHVPLV